MKKLLKVSDDNCVSWQATAVPAELARFASLGKFALVEVTKATIHHGYRLIIEAFEVVEEGWENEVILNNGETLELLDKEYYAGVFKKKGMLNKVGNKVQDHPGFQLTPVRMTRSKAFRFPT